jgi:CRISPR-associated endonuclease/helicase Cas3
MSAAPLAHSKNPAGVEQLLSQHLSGVSSLAREFGSAFDAAELARIAGWWHDAGKYSPDFQRMIRADADDDRPARVDHSSAGALLAARQPAGLPLAFAIAGHHGGLLDLEDLRARLKKTECLEQARAGGLPAEIEEQVVGPLPDWCRTKTQAELWTRFLYSALVDADFLDTECFHRGEARTATPTSLSALSSRLDTHLAELMAQAPRSPVNQLRARVLSYCRGAADWPPGNFTLTVPTGGGKTLASMAFALRHALRHGLRRVLVIIPFTSIIEQTAKVYRRVFGRDAVIEHHSSLDPERETPRNRLASENWDAPIVVTTSVQFFESLFANRPSRCRKLHNIAGSVVVFDEVQTFPPGLLAPILDVLSQLSAHYRVSQVFCTATQPALGPRHETVPPAPGIEGLREIACDVPAEFRVVAGRYRVDLPSPSAEPAELEALAAEVRGHQRILTVVDRRADAATLARLVGEDCVHLSARMCARRAGAPRGPVVPYRQYFSRYPRYSALPGSIRSYLGKTFPQLLREYFGPARETPVAQSCSVSILSPLHQFRQVAGAEISIAMETLSSVMMCRCRRQTLPAGPWENRRCARVASGDHAVAVTPCP